MISGLIGCDDAQSYKIAEVSFDYLFGVISKAEAKKILVNLGIDKSKLDIVNNGYIIRNCKYYIYAKTVNRKTNSDDYGIDRCDVILLDRIASSLHIEGCNPWSMQKLESNERFLVSQTLKTYIGKYISKKMSFLIKSYGVSRYDLETDLMTSALYTLHKRYPYFESSLHAINTVKTAIHNKGIDLINHYTRQKNQRLRRNVDGTFEAVNVDLSCLNDLEAPEPFEQRYLDERKSLKKLQDKMNDRGALFISLARGDFNEDFSDYLGFNNVEYAERNYGAYFKRVQKYLNVNSNQVENFLIKVRKELL